MTSFTAITGLNLYVAPTAGSVSAVAMTESPAGTYTADATDSWPVWQRLSASPDADDTQLTVDIAADNPPPGIRVL